MRAARTIFAILLFPLVAPTAAAALPGCSVHVSPNTPHAEWS